MIRSLRLSFSRAPGMSFPRALLVYGLAAISAFAVSACGMSGDDSAGGTPPQAGGGGGGVDESVDIPGPTTSPDPYTRFAHLCGDGCTPGGDPTECSSSGGDGSGTGGTTAQPLHCQLVLGEGDAIPSCRPVGRYAAGGPCHRGMDCAAGLGCAAADGQGGVCRQYCCGNVESCAPGTYCDERSMAESLAEGNTPVSIPVCVPATSCELLDDSVCPAGLTCTIVREDGTTSCVVPGDGRADDPCPCAPGFVCSMLTNQCKQLCRIDGRSQDCGTNAKCQGGSTVYPPGFGVCVSTM